VSTGNTPTGAPARGAPKNIPACDAWARAVRSDASAAGAAVPMGSVLEGYPEGRDSTA
jgi:hypothetical protein